MILSASSAAAQEAAPVLAENFEGDSAVTATLLRDPRLKIVAGEGPDGSRALRATYVGDAMGSERIVAALPLGEAGLEYTLSYDVRFASDFQFVRGGKLHGLGPDRPVTGGNPIRPDGWSTRVMWRAEGRPELYVYHQGQTGQYGEHGPEARALRFEPGRYHAVSLHVRVNDTATSSNGFVRLYIDGALVDAQEGIRLRGTDGNTALISRFLFSTFHGGNDPSWAPKTPAGGYAEVHAWFDNFAVHRGEKVRSRPAG